MGRAGVVGREGDTSSPWLSNSDLTFKRGTELDELLKLFSSSSSSNSWKVLKFAGVVVIVGTA